MPICIVVLSNREKANQLTERLKNASTPIVRCELIQPSKPSNSLKNQQFQDPSIDSANYSNSPQPIEINEIPLLNPELSRKKRQRNMAFILMPFGFIAGLTFAEMTGLTTFSDLGVNFFGERLTGGLVGMISGWMGSYAGAASVKSKNSEDINSLRKLSDQGLWLLLLETPFEVELPWEFFKEIEPIEVVRLLDQ